MTLDENKADREAAETVMSLIDRPQRPRFWEELQKMVAMHLPPPKVRIEDVPMNDDVAAKFEIEQSMPYGLHQGALIGEVPTEYLARVIDPSEFSVRLRRYVLSNRFKKRQGD